MPKTNKHQDGLLDTWGRRNRTLTNKRCANCGTEFRPLRAQSRYCSRPCAWANNGGHNRKPEAWHTNQRGYIEGTVWTDQYTQVFVKQHRWVMQNHIGRPLLPHEDVHHINGNKADNRIENLELIHHGAHSSLSNRTRKRRKKCERLPAPLNHP